MENTPNKSWIIQSQEGMDKAMFKQSNDLWEDLWDRYYKHLDKVFKVEQKEEKLTKEDIITKFILDNPQTTKDILMEKFNVSLDYAKIILKKSKGTLLKGIIDKND